MAKKSLIYFGIDLAALAVMILIFALFSLIIGPDFWEYGILITPVIVVPSIILTAIGIKYGKKTRLGSKAAINTFAIFVDTILVFLLIYFILFILAFLLIFSFAR